MNRNLICAMLLLLLLPVAGQAQRKKKKVQKEPEPVENPVFTRMLPATARLLVADSLVTDSTRLLTVIPTNPEEGRLLSYQQFLALQQGKTASLAPTGGIVFLNELGDKCIFSAPVGRKGQKHLFQSELIGGSWSKPAELAGLNDKNELTEMDYPFLMPDGVTLYFAARGGQGLGGYDIYCTRFDAASGRFLKPENLGLPYNSEADDYLYVVDEQNQLAYFASSRRQPRGKACLYTFVPTDTRTVLNTEAYSPERLRSLASLNRIADTWGKGAERKMALRRKSMAMARHTQNASMAQFSFVVNDRQTYTRIDQFRKPESRDHMLRLLALQQQARQLEATLAEARDRYAQANDAGRTALRSQILADEQRQEQLASEMAALEKQIRNTENQ